MPVVAAAEGRRSSGESGSSSESESSSGSDSESSSSDSEGPQPAVQSASPQVQCQSSLIFTFGSVYFPCSSQVFFFFAIGCLNLQLS